MNFSENLFTAVQAALLAGKEIMEVYARPFSVEQKEDRSPLTEADKKAHVAIKEVLSGTNIPLLSEEGKHTEYAERKNWKQLWIVDPLDGTKEFIKKNDEFTVNIALVENEYPVMGVLLAPALHTLYFAEKGSGVFALKIEASDNMVSVAEKMKMLKPVVAAQHLPDVFTIVASRSHMSAETEAFIKQKEKQHGAVTTTSSGSALKFCLVATGKAHCYPRFAPTMEWDTAAGQVLVEEAGLTLIDQSTGKRMRYNRENLRNNWFLVE